MEHSNESGVPNLLSYPVASSSKDPSPPPTSQARQLLKDRLYIGNLAPAVDEYTLLQVFSKYGKISKLDFLFHKSGPLKGKPRGYAFVEYADQNDAKTALVSANDKLLRGRKLVVTYAQQAPPDHAYGAQTRTKRHVNDTGKPTTLSLIKSIGAGRSSHATEDKIAKMEAKLRQMEQASSGPGSSVPPHPSLPAKPIGSGLAASLASMDTTRTTVKKAAQVLPNLPLAQPGAIPARVPATLPMKIMPTPTVSIPKKTTTLAGVKIKKHKDHH